MRFLSGLGFCAARRGSLAALFLLGLVSAHGQIVQIDGVVTVPTLTGSLSQYRSGTPVQLRLDIGAPRQTVFEYPDWALYQIPAEFDVAGQRWWPYDSVFVPFQVNNNGRWGIIPQRTEIQPDGTTWFVTAELVSTSPIVSQVGVFPDHIPVSELPDGMNVGFFGYDLPNGDGGVVLWQATSYSVVPEPAAYASVAAALLAGLALWRSRSRRHATREVSTA